MTTDRLTPAQAATAAQIVQVRPSEVAAGDVLRMEELTPDLSIGTRDLTVARVERSSVNYARRFHFADGSVSAWFGPRVTVSVVRAH